MPRNWQYLRIVFFILGASCGKVGGTTPVLMLKVPSGTKWSFFVKKQKCPKDLKGGSLTSYITSTVFLPLSFPSNKLLDAGDQSDTGGGRLWHITGIPLTDFYPVTLSAGVSWIVQASSNSLSDFSLSRGSTAYEEYPLFIPFKRITSAGTYVFMYKARKRHAKPHCFKYVCEIQ